MGYCTEQPNTISILEKINRLTQLFDPWLMPIDLVQFYAQNLGYDVGLNREQIASTIDMEPEEAKIEQNKYLRFMMSQLPEWYKVKTSRPSLKVMLYSFGLIGDVVYYYTKEYTDGSDVKAQNLVNNPDLADEQAFFKRFDTGGFTSYKEVYDALCKLKTGSTNILDSLANDWILTTWNPKSVNEDVSNIPDEYFPSPHFRLWFNLMESIESLTFLSDTERNDQMSIAINAIRPINTVYEGVSAFFSVYSQIYRKPYVRFRKNISLVSDVPADDWVIEELP